MSTPAKQRNPAMDVIRVFALLTVIGVHFFLNTDFYDVPVQGVRMCLMACMREFLMICVPLFLVLSGYLMKNKKISKSYYKGIVKTLAIYVLASLACGVYKYFAYRESFAPFGVIWGIFDYTTAPYSWYVEMYIGLFLLIPFLNLTYNNLESKKQKQALLLSLILLTAAPAVINTFSSRVLTNVLPDWWSAFYPITYYFIGCYLRDYPIKLKKRVNISLIIAVTAVFGAIVCYFSYGQPFPWSEFNEYKSLFVLILTVLVFSLFANLNYDKVGAKFRKVFSYLSNLVFGAYLCSWIYDDWFYGILNKHITSMPERLNYYILIVAAVFVCSLATSAVLNLIYSGAGKLWVKIRKTH